MHTVSTKEITDLIKNIGNQAEPIRSRDSLETLDRWLVDPLLILEPDQRIMIEGVLRENSRL